MYEDLCDEGNEPSHVETEYEEEIPVEAMPNIILPKVSAPTVFESCIGKVLGIKDPRSFYLRLNKDKEYFETFAKNLNNYYTNGKDPPLNSRDLPVLSTWAVFSDNCWYRAVVVTRVKEEKECSTFKMKFIDFGYTKLVNLKNIRYLEEEYTLDPPFALQCALSEVYPTNKWQTKPWSNEALEFFSDLCFASKEIKVIFMKDRGDCHWEVILETLGGEVVNEELVIRGFATSKLIKEFSPDDENSLPTMNSFHSSDSSKLTLKKSDYTELISTDWDPMADEYENGANTLFVNNESAELVLNGFENDDKTICRFFKFRGTCRKGDTCRWRHVTPRNDGLPSGIVLTYLHLEDEFGLPKVGSCHAASVTAIYSPREFYIQILNLTSSSSASFKNHRRKEYLKNTFLELHGNLTKTYKNSKGCLTPPLPTVGELMVAYSSKLPLEGYYRVRVLLVKETDDVIMVKVFFIDVGTTDWVKENQLRPFSPQFLSLAALAIRCYLSDVSPSSISNDWNSEAKKLFSDYVTDNLQTIIVTQLDEIMEDKIGVILINRNAEKTLNECLVESGVAEVENFISV